MGKPIVIVGVSLSRTALAWQLMVTPLVLGAIDQLLF